MEFGRYHMTARRLALAGALAVAFGLSAVPVHAQDVSGPPTRTGRLAQITGTVSFHTSDESQWQAATLNYPITSGNSLWTEPQAHAAIDVGGSRIYMNGATELDVGTLNDQSFVASLPQGAVYLRVSGTDGSFEVDTPRGAVTITQPGHYEVVAGDADHPTLVTALDGSAQVAGPGLSMTVPGGQSASLTGQNPVTASTGPAQQDEFIRYAYAAEQPYSSPGPAQQYVSPGVTGYQDLNQYGQWQQTPDYGAVWFPQVAVGWAPYRYGHWAYIAPWGWTWIDDAPWGFAPFHYGRWVLVGGLWGWVPGIIVAQPVYAPALVAFFGGVGVSIGIGPAVGWVPLGPQEVWYPPYRCGPRYFRNVNITNVNVTKIVNINNYSNTTIINNTVINNYRNFRGATVVQASAMTGSRNIGQAFHPLPANAWQGRQIAMRADPPVKPTLHTAGITPTVARKFGETLPANGQLPGRRLSPGPMFASSNRAGTAFDGHHLPAFAATQPQGGLGKTGNANNQHPAVQAGQGFGGFGQQGQNQKLLQQGQNRNLLQQGQNQKLLQQGQNQLKKPAPGPTILPHNNAGTAANHTTGTNQSRQGWSFLPPLQKQTQGSQQRGLQGGATGSGPQVFRNQNGAQGTGTHAQGWSQLPPLQKQPQASHNGVTGYQGNANWQQPQIYRGSQGGGQAGGAARPAQSQGNRIWQQQGWQQGGNTAHPQQQPANNRTWEQPQHNWQPQANWQQQGSRAFQQGGGFYMPQQNRAWQPSQGGFNFQQRPQQQPAPSHSGAGGQFQNFYQHQQGGG